MNEKQIAEIDRAADMVEIDSDTVHTLINEVRRLRAVVEVYADHSNWQRGFVDQSRTWLHPRRRCAEGW